MSSAKCVICTDEFPGIDDLEAHISADHYNCLPFECEKCKFAKFPTEFAIKRHYEEDHGLVEYFIRYRVSREIYEKKQKIRDALERCIRHSDVSSGQHQIALANRNIIGGDYPSASSSNSHYQSRLHENEFLNSTKIRAAHSELFQQQHGGPLLSSTAADIRHHQSDFGTAADTDSVTGYDAIGSSNLIGNLLEQIKPEVDGGALSHFDQLYAAEVTTASDAPSSRGIEKFITTQAQQSIGPEQISFLAQKAQALPISVNSVAAGGGDGGATSHKQNGSSSTVLVPSGISIHSRAMGAPTGRRPAELQCQVCKQMVVNRSTSLMYHVNVKHLHLPMFKCRSCGEEFQWNKSAAIRHAQRHGGNETLIENNSERLFPTLNRHRREYFNLAKRGLEDTPTPPPQQQDIGGNEQQKDNNNVNNEDVEQDEMGARKPTKMIKLETEIDGNEGEKGGADEEDGEEEHREETTKNVVVDDDGRASEGSEKATARQTPNSILAQLVDLTRQQSSQQHLTDDKLSVPIKTPSSTSSGNGQPGTSSGSGSTEKMKAHKTILCEGCGDQVINQEWIMLNHVNTKHLHLPLYRCVSCNKPFENYLRSYAARHAKFYHAGDETLLLDQREVFLGELRDECARLFGLNNKEGGGNE